MSKIEVDFATVALVTDSWAEVLKIPNATMVAGELLFRKIFEIAPGAWKMFPFGQGYTELCDEMFQSREFQSHAKQVVGMVGSAVHFLGPDLSVLEDNLIELGARHTTYGVLPEHYPIVGQALLYTLEAALGQEAFTSELKDAWAGLYGFITSSMVKGANESLLRLSFPLYKGNKHAKNKTQEERTLDEYISGMVLGQKDIYYVVGSDADASCDHSALRRLQEAGVEVLCLKKRSQDLVTRSLENYVGRRLVNLEDCSELQSSLSFLNPEAREFGTGTAMPGLVAVSDVDEDYSSQSSMQSTTCYAHYEFCDWFQAELGTDKVVKCTPTCQFKSLPARVISHTDDSDDLFQKLQDFDCIPLPKKHVEINMSHPVIVALDQLRTEQPRKARLVAEQILDNALIHAGLFDEGRAMVNRINELLLMAMKC